MMDASQFSRMFIRYTLTFLFFWSGFSQLVDASAWIPFLPAWTGYFPIPGEMLTQIRGLFEVCLAILLALGVSMRISVSLAALYILCSFFGFSNPWNVYYASLLSFCVVLFVQEPDQFTVDAERLIKLRK